MSMTTLTALGRCAAVLSSVTLFAGYMWYQSRGAHAPTPLSLEGRDVSASGSSELAKDSRRAGVGAGGEHSRAGEGAANLASASARSPGTSAPGEELDPATIVVPPEILRRAALMPGSKSSAFDLVHASRSDPQQPLVIIEPAPEFTPFQKIDANENYTFAAPAKNADPRQAAQKQAEDAKRQIFMSSSKSGAVFKEWRVIPHTGETVAPQRRVLMAGSKSALVGIYKSDPPEGKTISLQETAPAAPAQTAAPVVSGAGVPARQPVTAATPANPSAPAASATTAAPLNTRPIRPIGPISPMPLPAAPTSAPRQSPRELDTTFRYADPAPPPEPVYVPRRRVLMSSSKSGRVYEGDDLPPLRVPVPSQSAIQK